MKQDTVLPSCKVRDKERIYSGGFKASVLVRCMWSPQLSQHRAKHSATGHHKHLF